MRGRRPPTADPGRALARDRRARVARRNLYLSLCALCLVVCGTAAAPVSQHGARPSAPAQPWPGSQQGLLFLWEDASKTNQIRTAAGKPGRTCRAEPTGMAKYGRFWEMDLAGGNAAQRRARGRVATVGVEAMSFLAPVKVGDEVSIFTEVLGVGRTSLRIRVEAWRRHLNENRRVTEAVFTFVALDANGRPRPVDQPDR